MKTEYITAAVLCYNSENTVLDTLDSIMRQTYLYLDLIINDDASTDHSVEIINNWILLHKDRFRQVRLYKNECNRGINVSFDKLIRSCRTDWVKFIAADDMLLPQCIQKNYEFVCKNHIDSIVYSMTVPFCVQKGEIVIKKTDRYETEYAQRISGMSSDRQYHLLLRKDIQFSPTGFMSVKKYTDLGGISVKIRNIEDWPLRLLFTSKGNRIFFMREKTVMYRIADSVSHDLDSLYHREHLKQVLLLKKILIYPNISRSHFIYYFSEMICRFRYFVVIKVFHNRKTFLSKTADSLLKLLELNKLSERIWKLLYSLQAFQIRT